MRRSNFAAILVLAIAVPMIAIHRAVHAIGEFFERAIAFLAAPMAYSPFDSDPGLALDVPGAALPSALQHDMRHEADYRHRGARRNT